MNSQRRDFFLAFASGHAVVMGFMVITEASGHAWFDGTVAIISAFLGTVFFSALADAPHKFYLLGAIMLSVTMAASSDVPQHIVELVSQVSCNYSDPVSCVWLANHSDSTLGARFAAIGCAHGDAQSCTWIEESKASE